MRKVHEAGAEILVPRCDCCTETTGEIRHGNVASPPYIPDLAALDFFLFPRMKMQLKRYRFGSIKAILGATTKALNSIRKTDFQDERTLGKFSEHCFLWSSARAKPGSFNPPPG